MFCGGGRAIATGNGGRPGSIEANGQTSSKNEKNHNQGG
jgi:hypothetical protein